MTSMPDVTKGKSCSINSLPLPTGEAAYALPTRLPTHSELLIVVSIKGGTKMLWTIFVVLLVLWLLGMVSSYTMGGFIHLLLVIALVMLIINLVSGRRTVV
jgi:uncharacterized protein DUF5670